jgi:hypothetical protein
MLIRLVYLLFVFNCLYYNSCEAQIDYIGRPSIDYVNSHHKVWDIKGVYFTGRYGASSSFIKYSKIGMEKRWFYGIGIHATLSFLSQKSYTTAATNVIKNSNDWFAVSFSDIDERVDTLTINQSFNLFGNLYFALQYRFNTNHELGLQIDLLGATFGLPTSANLISSELPTKSVSQTALPTLFNYTLISSNNRGSLLYALNYRYWFNDRLGTNASINYVYTEYRTSDRLVFNNSRFRNKSFCFMIGVSYAPFHKKYKD